ncbi:MAG TPA: VWA domain-containing protein [Candidatus Cybelea sp.]|nr:VWA domain-containing protein [Candidatus Cybelea sp.]
MIAMWGRLPVAAILLAISLVIFVSFVGATPALAQESDPATHPSSHQQSSQTQPSDLQARLRVTTRLVQVNVIVTDKHGSPVTGLTKDDFELLDNKKRQEIRVFSEEMDSRPAVNKVPLSADTYSNRIDLQEGAASATVILLDTLNTDFADQALAQKQLLKFLETLQPQDHVALYWLGNSGLRVLQDFTTDSSALREAAVHFKAESGQRLTNSEVPDVTSETARITASHAYFRSAFEQRAANFSTQDRVRLTVAALITIANHIGWLKGRKSLVWISGSFPISMGYDNFDLDWLNDTGVKFDRDVVKAGQALSDASVAVYPVDARGLLGSDIGSAANDSGEDASSPLDPNTHGQTRTAATNLDTLRVMADRTGGKAFYGTNNIAGAIRHAIDDSRLTYTLGYYPAQLKWDGSFHEIKVRVRTPGAQVRARSGYFASPEPVATPLKSFQAVVAQTAVSQLEGTGIAIQVHVHILGPQTLVADLHFDLHEIGMEQNNGHWFGTLRLVFLQVNSQQQIVQVNDKTFHLNFDSPTYERLLKDGMIDTRRVQMLPNATQLSVVLRDASNGNVGSVAIPVAKYLSSPMNAIH